METVDEERVPVILEVLEDRARVCPIKIACDG
jgi:hypothetical protein